MGSGPGASRQPAPAPAARNPVSQAPGPVSPGLARVFLSRRGRKAVGSRDALGAGPADTAAAAAESQDRVPLSPQGAAASGAAQQRAGGSACRALAESAALFRTRISLG